MLRPGFHQHKRLLIWDTFDRADSTTLGTSTSGHNWIATKGTIGTLGGLANHTEGSSVASIDCSVTNYRISYKVTSMNFMGIGFRIASGNTLFFFRSRPENVELYQGVSGTNTLLSQVWRASSVGEIMTLEVSDLEVKIYADGVFLISVTLPEHTRTTLVGLRGGGTASGATLDNFVVEVL